MIGRCHFGKPLEMEEVRPIGEEPIQYASIPGIKCNKLFEVVWDADGFRI